MIRNTAAKRKHYREYMRKWYAKNHERLLVKQREWARGYRARNRERLHAYQNEWNRRHASPARRAREAEYERIRRARPEVKIAIFRARLKKQYRVTLEWYQTKLAEQTGRCAICGKLPRMRRLAVDHDHRTGIIRGLLCASCNGALGHFEDAIWLSKMTAYAAQYRVGKT